MKGKTWARCLALLIPLGLMLLYLCKDIILGWMQLLPPCYLYSHFGLYCPACGNTRSVAALLEGDLSLAIQFNIVPIILLLIALTAYAELVAYSFGKKLRLLPRQLGFYILLIAIVLVYLIMRNFIPALAP